MQYKPILDAIKAILVADTTANGLIKVYRTFMLEPGVYATPACVIGTTMEMRHEQSYLSGTKGAHPRLWAVSIGISILGRAYPTQAQTITEAEKLDDTQAAVYTALNVDTSITSTVTLSLLDRIRSVTISSGEYFGHELIIEAKKKEG